MSYEFLTRSQAASKLGTPEAQSALSNEYLLTAINSASRDNVNFVQNLANQLNCDTNAIQNAINQVSQTVGLGQKDISIRFVHLIVLF